MSQRTSFSQNSTYIQCPEHWSKLYVEKWRSPAEGASLFFGTAVDAAVREMLENKPDWLKSFYDRWECAFENGKPKPIFDNMNIVYSYSDYDEHVFEPKDVVLMDQWIVALNLSNLGSTPTEVYKAIAKIKKNPYKRATDDEIRFFNRTSWLSLKRKGKVLLNSFATQFLPKIKKVIAIQEYGKIEDPGSGDVISGFIDMVLEIDGYDRPIIFDLKTAAMPYTQEQIDLTDQLTLYSAMKADQYNTDLVGYVVLCKNIPKDTVATCNKCGNIKNSRHQTCDANDPIGNRCNGTWNEVIVLKPEVQVLVEKKSPTQVNSLLGDISNIVLAMKNRIVYKNTNKCNDWYGNRCPYYNACHKNDYTGLVKK